jgi:hypothetical protein
MERLCFVNLSYGKEQHPFMGKVNICVFFTMNAPENYYRYEMEQKLMEQVNWLRALNGKIMVLPSFDTLQVKDYSKYDMEYFDETHKKQVHETQFTKDLDMAYQIGMELSRI